MTSNKKQICAVVAICTLICGCVVPKTTTIDSVTKTFNHPFDRVWIAMVSTTSGTFPFQAIEKDSGILETQMVNFGTGSLYASRPPAFLPVWETMRGRISIFVQPLDSTNTSVRIISHFEGFESNVGKSWYVWNSTGLLESNILASAESKLPK